MKPAVLLVHGIFDRGSIFKGLSAYLESQGMEPMSPDFRPNDGSESLAVLAEQVKHYVDELHTRSGRPVYLVGFSMGGLICRYYMQDLNGVEKVDRWITISSPHHGTWTASLFWGKGVAQMRVGSSFLKKLNDEVLILNKVPTLSLWTPFDMMIVPADSSRLPIGENILVECIAHPLMHSNKTVFKHIGDFLQND